MTGIYRLVSALLAVLPLASVVRAQPPPTQPIPTTRLLQPADVTQVSLSPAGSRIAALTGGAGDRELIVLEWRGGAPTLILASRLSNHRSITSYEWLSDDYLLLQYADFEQNLTASAIASIPRRDIRFLEPLTRLIKAHWGDANHVLLAVGSNCHATVASTCLKSLNLVGVDSNQISEPTTLLPVQFLAVSPAEIYAGGRDVQGMQREYRLDPATHAWRPIANGTLESRQAALQAADQPSAEMLAAAARTGIRDQTLVVTQPGHHLVGVIGRAPERAFVSLDSRLDGVQVLLEKTFTGARVSMSRLNDELTRGLVTVWDADRPPRYFFLNDASGLTEYTQFGPQIDPTRLGRTHIERDWASGVPVAVTLPPAGVAVIGVVVMPLTASERDGEEPLHAYHGDVQAFALRGIAVVRELESIPDSFADNSAGAAWRAALTTRLQSVVAHVSAELLHGGPVCLYGIQIDGELALAAGSLPHVGCAVAVNALLRSQSNPLLSPQANSQRQLLGTPVQLIGGGAGMVDTIVAASQQMLKRDLPAVFGADGGQLTNAMPWVDKLPATVMLAYGMRDNVSAEYALDSAGFRSAAHKAGKTIVYYAPNPGHLSDFENGARMLDAVVGYVHDFYGSGARTAANN